MSPANTTAVSSATTTSVSSAIRIVRSRAARSRSADRSAEARAGVPVIRIRGSGVRDGRGDGCGVDGGAIGRGVSSGAARGPGMTGPSAAAAARNFSRSSLAT